MAKLQAEMPGLTREELLLRRRQQRRSMLSWAESGDAQKAPESLEARLENEVNAALQTEVENAPKEMNNNLDINQNGIGPPSTDEM